MFRYGPDWARFEKTDGVPSGTTVTTYIGGSFGNSDIASAARAVTGAVIGGISAEAAGGSFANGAATGAFAALFGEIVRGYYASQETAAQEQTPSQLASTKGGGARSRESMLLEDMNLDPNDPNCHHYEVQITICEMVVVVCTTDNVYISLRQFPAPGFDPRKLVNTGDRSTLSGGLGPVRHFVDQEALTVYNITEQGHILDSGYVCRSVVVQYNAIYIHTIGEGTGAFPGINSIVGRALFEDLDFRIRLDVTGGY